MSERHTRIDLNRLHTQSIRQRKSKVSESDFAQPWKAGGSFTRFLERLPRILAGSDLRGVIHAVAAARRHRRPVILAMGAHVIKVGLNPVLVDLMEHGVITAVAVNGAALIHDLEVAMTGCTSEDVAVGIRDGSFGVTRETCDFLNRAIRRAGTEGRGLGEAVGEAILESGFPFLRHSLFAQAHRMQVPVTVHIAIGTDVLHIHPGFDAGAAGAASHRDFRLYAALVSDLENGVYLNVGSAVILPEVFLKAVTLVRNLGTPLKTFTTVNLDFLRHYRPAENVLHRPTSTGGRGIQIIGHHEILLPLIAAGVIEAMDRLPPEA